MLWATKDCTTCNGEKRVHREKDGMIISCPDCNGKGWHYVFAGHIYRHWILIRT